MGFDINTCEFFNFDARVLEAADTAISKCAETFGLIEKIQGYNSQKVLRAFIDNKVRESDFGGSTGYGYGDSGRDTLDRVFAQVMGAQDALVRHNFVSGTHALTTALFGVLRPGDTIVCLTGAPYDTIHSLFGKRGSNVGALTEFGINYRELPLLKDGTPDYCAVSSAVKNCKMAYIQRSRGYTLRPSLTADDIKMLADIIRATSPDAVIMIDNCYGEFVQEHEPTQLGADLMAGSLIKNPGGGIARTGGYICGRADLIDLCAHRLTAPGVGREAGCTLGETRSMLLGLFLAPAAVEASLKTAAFAAALFETLGYKTSPRYNERRADIIQALELGSERALIAFCRSIQSAAPVDSFVVPQPWPMPGYDCDVIMASGAFTMGSSIELSADAPLREPYAVWLQGGLSFHTAKIGVLAAAQALLDIA